MNTAMLYQMCIPAMGTRLQLLLPEVDQQDGDFLQTLIVARVDALEQSLSLYRNDSALARLNEQLNVATTVDIDDEDLALALHLAQLGRSQTNGFYDAACGELMAKIKQQARATPVANDFHFTEQNTLQVERPGVQFDFGGLGKGIAVDKIVDILQQQGVANGLVSFGESSVYGLGRHPHGEHWPIAVPAPQEQDTLVEIHLHNSGVTLSSTVANGANHGAIQQHIINPITANVVSVGVTSVVESRSMAWGEMLSTASLISGVEFTSAQLPEEVGLKQVRVFRH